MLQLRSALVLPRILGEINWLRGFRVTKVFKSQIEIRTSARRVFEALSNPSWLAAGLPIEVRIEVDPPGPIRRGTRLRAIGRISGKDQAEPLDIEVTEVIAPRVVEIAGFLSPKQSRGRSVSRYEIEQYGELSVLKVTSRTELDSWLLWLAWPLMLPLVSFYGMRQLKAIKAEAEKKA
jgi:hypothetical protein